jgi:hypothetical protein
MGRCEYTFFEAQQASKNICKVRSLKSRIKTCSFLEAIITYSNEEFKDCVSDIAVEIRKLGNPTRENAENNHKVNQIVGS